MEEFNEDIPLRTECSQIFHSLHTVQLWVVNGDMGGGGGWETVQNISHKNLFQLKNNSCDLKKKNYAKEHVALKANYSFTFKATWWESSIILSVGASSDHGKGSSFAASSDEWSSMSFAFVSL